MFLFKISQKICAQEISRHGKQKIQNFQTRSCTKLVDEKLEPLAEAYKPTQVEANKWNRDDCELRNRKNSRGTFRMILPPPNVTGNLHLGHALMATIQDVICRHKRQMGFDVEWIPGTDHAGIATQAVVEKKLLRESGLKRQHYGKRNFLEKVANWKNDKTRRILKDLRNLGCTLDWNAEYFTMDEKRTFAVNEAFIRLFEDGLIEQKNGLVNWSCMLQSVISDIEIDNVELKGPTEFAVPGHSKNVIFGRLYNIGYQVCDFDENIVVATTRPETMLGDVAVAVHPADERYEKYLNFAEVRLWHPFRREAIPLIFDTSVDRSFGTGAVKITPAHDKKDFEIAERHLLNSLSVFTEQGTIADTMPLDFRGLPRFEAREHILSILTDLKLLHSVRDHAMTLPVCSRSKDIVEYMVKSQWYLHTQPLATEAAAAVRSGRLVIVPEKFENEWYRWLDNCHDWCISRQLWWGHRIPVYFVEDTENEENNCWVAAHNETDAIEKGKKELDVEEVTVEQDEDVLDTWFSSSLLPFSVFNWPSAEYKQKYPLDVLETGHDILFFWVARMVMMGLKLTGELPFKKVLLNGILCDANGRKMSKSIGNIVTPQQVIEGATVEAMKQDAMTYYEYGLIDSEELAKSMHGIEKMFPQGIKPCGIDALRLTLCSHNFKNHFVNFDVTECHTNKLFINKIWQATRYTLASADRLHFNIKDIESLNNVQFSVWDRWILSRLAETITTCTKAYADYNFNLAVAELKQFLYTNLCDVYLETTKLNIRDCSLEGRVNTVVLATCLSQAFQTLSPITPFVTEELLKYFPLNIQMNYANLYSKRIEEEIFSILNICQFIRQLKSRSGITRKHEPKVLLYAENEIAMKILQPHLKEIQLLTLTNEVKLHKKNELTESDVSLLCSSAGHLCTFRILTNNSLKFTQKKLKNINDLNQSKLQRLQSDLLRYRSRLDNDGYIRSASAQVQLKHKEKIKQIENEILKLNEVQQ